MSCGVSSTSNGTAGLQNRDQVERLFRLVEHCVFLGVTMPTPNGERTRDGMNAARAKGSKPGRPPLDQEKLSAALMLVKGGMSPTQAARQTGLGRSTVYREIQSRPNA